MVCQYAVLAFLVTPRNSSKAIREAHGGAGPQQPPRQGSLGCPSAAVAHLLLRSPLSLRKVSEDEDAKLLTAGIAMDAFTDASAATVEVMTDAGPPMEIVPSAEGLSSALPEKPKDEVSPSTPEVPEVPTTTVRRPSIRRDSTLLVPSPRALDAEIMQSNSDEAQRLFLSPVLFRIFFLTVALTSACSHVKYVGGYTPYFLECL